MMIPIGAMAGSGLSAYAFYALIYYVNKAFTMCFKILFKKFLNVNFSINTQE